MNKMKAQGTTPEFVSLGNEVQAGMLYPDGSCDNFAQLSELFNTGYDAVKAVSPDSRSLFTRQVPEIKTCITGIMVN